MQHLRWKLLTNFTKSPILDFAGSWICLDIYQDIFQEKMAILERWILLFWLFMDVQNDDFDTKITIYKWKKQIIVAICWHTI